MKSVFLNLNLFLISLITILSACDPVVSHQNIIENQSDFDLWVLRYQRFSDSLGIDSLPLPALSEQIVWEGQGVGDADEFEDCIAWMDSLQIIVVASDSLRVQVDPNLSTSWSFQILKSDDISETECRLKISNELIQ